MNESPVILFDGVCNLCRASVQFVLKHDRKNLFLFASQQSDVGASLLQKYASPEQSSLSTVVLIEDGKAYDRSDAILRIMRKLRFPWPLFYLFILLPRFMRDAAYNFIGKNRYAWFGKMDECWVPTADLKARFIDQEQD